MKPLNVLCLDGGGSKGVYTIGILSEFEAMLCAPLADFFDLIYGVSTGSIIAAGASLGFSMEMTQELYMTNIPKIMGSITRRGRSGSLRACLREAFGESGFTALRTDLGIIATDMEDRSPVIFKSNIQQAQAGIATFVPGFGCTIAKAVQGSCSAYPFFLPEEVTTVNKQTKILIDGGFSANNPTLAAYVDAQKSGRPFQILSLGVGEYPPRTPWRAALSGLLFVPSANLIETQFGASANYTARVSRFIAEQSGINLVRISEKHADPALASSLLEHNKRRLDRLVAQGKASCQAHERVLLEFIRRGRLDVEVALSEPSSHPRPIAPS